MASQPFSRGGKGMLSVACNTNPVFLFHKREQLWASPPPLAQVELCCPPVSLLCRVGLPGAGIPAMSAMHCPPLCPQRVRSPCKQEARSCQEPSVGEWKGGSATGTAAAAVPVPPCFQPRQPGAASRAFSPLLGRQHPHFFAGQFFKSLST